MAVKCRVAGNGRVTLRRHSQNTHKHTILCAAIFYAYKENIISTPQKNTSLTLSSLFLTLTTTTVDPQSAKYLTLHTYKSHTCLVIVCIALCPTPPPPPPYIVKCIYSHPHLLYIYKLYMSLPCKSWYLLYMYLSIFLYNLFIYVKIAFRPFIVFRVISYVEIPRISTIFLDKLYVTFVIDSIRNVYV